MTRLLPLAAAAALTLSALPALAQSSVTMYGRLNLTVERLKVNGVTSTDMLNNASRIGMKGTEELGGGMKAGFQLEHGFAADTGAASQANFWARQSEVNLSGGFGMLRLGNFTSEAYFATADYVSMHNHDTGTSSDALYASTWTGNDKIAYRLPALGGLSLEAAFGLAEGGRPNRLFELAANYDMGNWHFGAGYEKMGSAKQLAVRALVEMGALTLGGYIQHDTDMTCAGSRNNFRLAAAYAVGNGDFHANLGKAGNCGGVSDSGATQFTLGYNHNLSKRTKLYGYLTRVSAQANAPYSDLQSLAVGVRHNF